jgi:hypothetical protein
MQAAEKEMEAAKADRRAAAVALKEVIFQKGEIEHEIGALGVKYKAEVE